MYIPCSLGAVSDGILSPSYSILQVHEPTNNCGKLPDCQQTGMMELWNHYSISRINE